MKKRIYRAISVNSLDLGALMRAAVGGRLTFGCDAAKRRWFGAFMNEHGVVNTVRWDLGSESSQLMAKLDELVQAGVTVEIALESTGTYGEPWCELARSRGLPIYRVSAKHAHDYQEIYDGVPSGHDAKSAAIIAKLHLEGRSRLWQPVDQKRRDLRSQVDMLKWVTAEEVRWMNRLEARVARHWPELLGLLSLKRVTTIQLLATYGGPGEVASSSSAAARLMGRCSQGKLSADRIAAVLASAKQTIGVAIATSEREQLQWLARRVRRARKECRRLRAQVNLLGKTEETICRTGEQVGLCTAAVLHAALGDLADYGSVRALYHAAGLNLKLHSSGEPRKQPRLSITKRGSSMARHWLFLATLRWLKGDQLARAWYQQKVARNGGIKLRAVVALMRKLLAGLFHLARGATFDSRRLFDVRRLPLPATTAA